MDLDGTRPIFIGMKLDGPLRRRLASLTGPDRAYVSSDNPMFLIVCRLGEDEYVGKIVEDRLTTDRIDDIRRNVISILQRLFPETRLPVHLEIVACDTTPLSRAIEIPPSGS